MTVLLVLYVELWISSVSLSDVNSGTAMLLGPVLDPMRSSSILKKSSHLCIFGMKQHSYNAMYLANKFKNINLKYNYPGLPSHEGYEVFNKILNKEFGYGGMISIDMGISESANELMETHANGRSRLFSSKF